MEDGRAFLTSGQRCWRQRRPDQGERCGGELRITSLLTEGNVCLANFMSLDCIPTWKLVCARTKLAASTSPFVQYMRSNAVLLPGLANLFRILPTSR